MYNLPPETVNNIAKAILLDHGEGRESPSTIRPESVTILGNFHFLCLLSYRLPMFPWIAASAAVNHHDVNMERITNKTEGLVENMLRTEDQRTITKDSVSCVLLRGIPDDIYDEQKHGPRLQDGDTYALSRSSVCFEQTDASTNVTTTDYCYLNRHVLALFRKIDFRGMMNVLGVEYTIPDGMSENAPIDGNEIEFMMNTDYAAK